MPIASKNQITKEMEPYGAEMLVRWRIGSQTEERAIFVFGYDLQNTHSSYGALRTIEILKKSIMKNTYDTCEGAFGPAK